MKSIHTSNTLPVPLPLSYNPQGIGDVDVADPAKPIEVLVGPINLKPRDRIDLFWGANDDIIYTYTHSSESSDTNGIFSLYVDTHWIYSGLTDVRYTYTPFPSNIQEHSPVNKVVVKLEIPGGRDPDPATPYENEKLKIPTVNPEGVITSPEGVTVTVDVYENMLAGDTIFVYWHGIRVEHPPLTADQLGKPITVEIKKQIIIDAGDSENVVVRYEIRDIVNNWSRFSLPAYIVVEAGNSSLPAPIVPQAPNMELDLDKLTGADVQALVLSNPDIGTGDIISFVMERNTAEGIQLESFTVSKVVQIPGSFVEFLIPNEQFHPIAQGRARLKYTVTKAAGNVLRSKSLTLAILGQPQQLSLPYVQGAINGMLDPEIHNVITQVPPYYFMADGNDISLMWIGKTATGETVMHQETKNLNADDISKAINFLIPDEKLSVLAGGTLEVYYTVTTYTKAFFKSPVLQLIVDEGNSIPLPAPIVDQVNAEGILDPVDIKLEAIARVLPYRTMAESDKVTIIWEGVDTGGSYSTYTVINNGTVNREIVFRIPKSYVDANLNGLVQVWYTVQNGERVATSEKLAITISETAALLLPAPTVKEATGGTLDPANASSGATVVIDAAANLKTGDQVIVQWQGPKGSDTKEKTLTAAEAGKALEVLFAAVLVTANAGQTVSVSYVVNRSNGLVQASDTLALQVLAASQELVLDTSPVELAGKVYLLVSYPDLLPNFPADTTVQRQASGGQTPYSYASSDPLVAKVDANGLVSVRGKGATTITVTDALGASKSYPVSVTGVIHCLGVGSGSFSKISKAASNNGARIPSIHELVEIHAAYGNRWPMGNGNYWSSTVSSAGIGGWNWYYVKNMVTGGNFKLKSHNSSLGVAIK
ncbi:Ig-like domain-containing protein [Pseudomonas syringae]|uniref:Ig-like domain-containing protein n=3 Tax=Pseudomonas syringae TaxID=317 RepID=UPI0004664563|nr:Ig-like domain-containing protein [Pseudomonas syringae]